MRSEIEREKMNKQIDWSKASIQDYKTVRAIVKRANDELGGVNVMSLQMDIIATHVSGCKLKLGKLLESNMSDFLHDICGIANHINRTTGELQNCFLPRCAE